MLSPRPILVAVISVFIVLVVVHDADARKRVDGRMFTPDQLYGYCTEYGGQYWPPGLGGAYACVLPDGTLIVCGGDFPYYCVESRTLDDKGLGLSEVQLKNIATGTAFGHPKTLFAGCRLCQTEALLRNTSEI